MHARAIPFLEPLPWDVTCKSEALEAKSTRDIAAVQNSIRSNKNRRKYKAGYSVIGMNAL